MKYFSADVSEGTRHLKIFEQSSAVACGTRFLDTWCLQIHLQRNFFSVFVMVLLFFLLNLSKSEAAIPPGELQIALNAEFETLNPIVNSMMAAFYIQDACLRPLVALTPEGKPWPLLIKEIPSEKNHLMSLGPQGQKAKIEILPTASWGDGKPVTCEDVRAAWLIGKDDNVSSPLRQEFLNIKNIEIDTKNPKKCEILFKEAKWNFYLNFPKPIPAHLEMKVYSENRGKAQAYERNSLYVREPGNPGLYNGAFVVSELKLGSHVVLQPNPFFYGEKPHLKKVVFKFILNSASLESHLLAGDVNMISSSGLTFDQALALEKKIAEKKLPYQVRFVDGTVYAHVDFNLDHPILADLKVRKAMTYAVNKQEIVKAFFEDHQRPALHFSTYLDSWYTDKPGEIELYPFDKTKAMKLLDEAGWKLGSDGVRVRDGKRMMLTLVGAADIKLYEVLQAYLQSSWRKIGIEVSIKKYPARILFSEILRQRKFDLGMYSWVSSPDGTQRSILHSDSIPSQANSWSGSNRPGWKNSNVDKWLVQAEQEFSLKKRVVLMKKVLRAYTEELPALPLFYRSNNSVVPTNLKNYQPSGHVFSEYLTIEKWQIP